jgi:tRNA-specific 2-thiouridylase
MIKAVGLFSGGLDSMLAIKLIKDQGIEVHALQFRLGFEMLKIQRRVQHLEPEISETEIEQQLGLKIQHLDVAAEFLRVVFDPQHGYGSTMNPCIDCKIFLLKKAKEYMETQDAHFVFTGEVLGQRPMSQHRDTLRHIEKASGLVGYLLRPLSAQLFEPTIPEQQGWVDRARFLGISGRSRVVQVQLAEQYQFRYHQPAGGCLLTDPNFEIRLQDLMQHKLQEQIMVADIELLKLGRHFRLSETLKVIVGRHEFDNNLLEHHTAGRWHATVREYQGPLVLIDGDPSDQQFEQIAQIAVRYTKGKHAELVNVDFCRDEEQRMLTVIPDKSLNIEQWRIG